MQEQDKEQEPLKREAAFLEERARAWEGHTMVTRALERGEDPMPSVRQYFVDAPESDVTSDAMSYLGHALSSSSSSPSHHSLVPGNRLNEQFVHVEKHEYVQRYCRELVQRWRYRVDPMWSIEVRVQCPDEMGNHEARVWWDEECWYACIEIGCQHLEHMLEWLVVHEVCELRRWRSTGHTMEILDMLVDGADKDRLIRGFHIARNQEVEMEVYDLLGHRRPFHIREGVEEEGAELNG